jgi:hypothetical protein
MQNADTTLGTMSDAVTVLVDAVRVRELTQVLGVLEQVGARPIVFKGAALAHTHYPESWQRPRIDADVLIDVDSRERVFGALLHLGYERAPLVSGDLVMYQATFFRVDRLGVEHALDMHWRIANPQMISLALRHDELVERGSGVAVDGGWLRVPCAVDALLIACVHRAAHHDDSEDPVWLHDIHLVATGLTPDEWGDFVERASARSVAAICLRGLQLARAASSTTIPSEVIEGLGLAAVSREPSRLFLRKDLRGVDRLLADLRVLRPAAAARLLREHLFPPATYMASAYGVRRRALLPIYYAARALGGMFKWFRAA